MGDGDWIRIHPRPSLLHQTCPSAPKNRFLALIYLSLHSNLLPLFPSFQISFKFVCERWWLGPDAVMAIGPPVPVLFIRSFIFGKQSKSFEVLPFSHSRDGLDSLTLSASFTSTLE